MKNTRIRAACLGLTLLCAIASTRAESQETNASGSVATDGSELPVGRDVWRGPDKPTRIHVYALWGNNSGLISTLCASSPAWDCASAAFPIGSISGVLLVPGYPIDFDFRAGASTAAVVLDKFHTPNTFSPTAVTGYFDAASESPIQCGESSGCSGSFDLKLYARYGTVVGSVMFDTGEWVPAGWGVVATDPEGVFQERRTSTQPGGLYDFSSTRLEDLINPEFQTDFPGFMILGPLEIPITNSWGLPVLGDGCGVSSLGYRERCSKSAGTKSWSIASGGSAQTVTVTSSQAAVATFVVPLTTPPDQPPPDTRPPTPEDGPEKDTGADPSDDRDPSGDPPNGSCDPGEPVSVTSGSVYLDQTDIVMGGLRRPLALVRSYNSLEAFHSRGGMFGPGWHHSFEKKVIRLGVDHLRLDLADGNSAYFVDGDGDGRHHAYLPASETSSIVAGTSGYTREFRNGGIETYDADGRLSSQADRLGNTTTLAYDGEGRLVSVTDPSGRAFSFVYRGIGEPVSQLVGPEGVAATYEIDFFGMLSRVSYPDGTGSRFAYDASGRLLSVRDATRRIVELHDYAPDGRALTSEIGSGVNKYTFAYQPGVTAVTDALGHVTNYEWQTVGGVRRVTKMTGCSVCGGSESREWGYDLHGRIVSVKDGLGRVTSYARNAAGDITATTDPLQTTRTFTYDSLGRLLTRVGPGPRSRTVSYAAAGLGSVTDALNRTSSVGYDPVGRPVSITDPRGKITTLAYDATGNLQSITDPLGRTSQFSYDTLGRRTVARNPLSQTVATTYDARGRVTGVTYPDASHTAFEYDSAGLLRSQSDRAGRKTQYAYDTFGRLTGVVDPIGATTGYAYDQMSRLVSVRDANGNRTSFEYDSLGRPTRTTDADGAVQTTVYDAAGRPQSYTDRRGVVTTYSFDELGRLAGVTYSDGTPPATYIFDGAGLLASAANGSDTLTWTYDDAGGLVAEHSARNASTVTYTYAPDGRRASLSLGGAPTATYAYDDAGRLTSIAHGTGAFSFGYDAADRRTDMTAPNGVTTTYSYDGMSQLTALSAALGPTPITSLTYQYDAAGNRVSKAEPDRTETYSYDSLDRLVAATRNGVGADRWVWGYDPVGNRTRQQRGVGALESARYGVGNRLLDRVAGGTLTVAGTLDEPGRVTVNGREARLSSGDDFEAEVPATPGVNTINITAQDPSGNSRTSTYQIEVTGSSATYRYDSNGNLVGRDDGGATWAYEWNANNILTRVVRDGSEVARFEYDPLGRRLLKTTGAVSTSWTYDGSDILRESRSDGTVFSYIHGRSIDEPLARQDVGGNVVYYHADGLGSVTATTNSAGTVVSNRQYDAWGNLETGAAEPGYAFTGREWDPETGLYYYRARYYDPKAGRFISEDPIGYGGGVNMYSYVLNSPLTLQDPFGRDTITATVNASGSPSIGLGVGLGVVFAYGSHVARYLPFDIGLTVNGEGEIGAAATASAGLVYEFGKLPSRYEAANFSALGGSCSIYRSGRGSAADAIYLGVGPGGGATIGKGRSSTLLLFRDILVPAFNSVSAAIQPAFDYADSSVLTLYGVR